MPRTSHSLDTNDHTVAHVINRDRDRLLELEMYLPGYEELARTMTPAEAVGDAGRLFRLSLGQMRDDIARLRAQLRVAR